MSPGEKVVVVPEYTTYQPSASSSSSQSEPLLSLLTSSHPLLGHAINHSVSAYNAGKAYSGPFKSSVEYVERNIASPVANTMGTAGRISGVENGVRWWLERRRSSSNGVNQLSSPPRSSNAHKRRREESESDIEQGLPAQRSRAASDMSMNQGEYLPAYDANQSPSYSSRDPYPTPDDSEHSAHGASSSGQTWQTRLMLHTSGLGVAMSGESRRSLKYCLSWLRWANGRLGRTLYALQTVLSEYEAAQRQAMERSNGTAQPGSYSASAHPRDMQAMSAQLNALKAECVKTLQSAMDVVSKYAGGALPENARLLVRRHLTSLPQRFAFMASLQEKEEEVLRRNAEARRSGAAAGSSANGSATPASASDLEAATPASDNGSQSSQNGEANPHEQENVVLGARRVVVLAREGLDMMSQVSAVVDGTITSAEQWCERLGTRLPDEEHGETSDQQATEDRQEDTGHVTPQAQQQRGSEHDTRMEEAR